jgi:hypothetical protein
MPEWSILGMAFSGEREHAWSMRPDRTWLLGLLAALVLAPAQGAAASVPAPPQAAVQCPPGMLCRTVIDRAAWDERVTLILRPAWDELVPVVLVPARTQMRSVVVRPADVVHHKDLVTPARTVTHTYLIEAAHYEMQRQWVSSGHWQDHYVDTSGYVYRPGYYRTIPGEWRTTAGSSHWHPGYSVYVPGRSWQEPGYWATRPGRNVRTCYWWGWCFERYVPGSDYWVPGKTVYVPGYSYSVPGSSHWHAGYTYYVPPRSEWVPESREYVRSGHWATRYVDTSHYVTRRVFVPDLWGTRTQYIPAVYYQWDELVPAVTQLVPYTVPAVMGTRVLHHPAVTRTEIRHHDALTREIATDPAYLSTQSRQSAASRNVPGTSAASTGLRSPSISIALVAGAGLSAGDGGAWSGSSGPDSWWVDRSAGGWVSSGAAETPGASSSSINSRAVSDDPSRGDPFLTSGGPAQSSGGNELLSDLLLLTGLATAGAAAHQLARSSAARSSRGHTPAVSRPHANNGIGVGSGAHAPQSQASRLSSASTSTAVRAWTGPTDPRRRETAAGSTAQAVAAVGESGAWRFTSALTGSLVENAANLVVGMAEGVVAVGSFALKAVVDPRGASRDVAAVIEDRNAIGRAMAYGVAGEIDRVGSALESGDPARVGDALGDILTFSLELGTLPAGAAVGARGVGPLGKVASVSERSHGLVSAPARNWQFGRLPEGVLGVTDPLSGKITIRRGLTGRVLDETVRHERVHSALIPGNEALAGAKWSLYQNSHLARYSEEVLAEAYATHDLLDALRFPFQADYKLSKPRLAAEAAAVGAAGAGATYLLVDR